MTTDKHSRSFKIAVAAIFTALVFVATYSFVIAIPATSGYFNLGEIVIYITALVFGPLVGGVAGGVGAALSDALVAPAFAPGTLIIKAIEGVAVGYLGKRTVTGITASKWRALSIVLGVSVGLLLAITGYLYLSGDVSLYLGIPAPANPTVTFFVPPEIWYGLGTLSALLIIYVCLKVEPQTGWTIFSIIPGGLAMVAGYFLYETLILGKTAAALEIPLNIGQMLIGLVFAVPISRIILRMFPQLKS